MRLIFRRINQSLILKDLITKKACIRYTCVLYTTNTKKPSKKDENLLENKGYMQSVSTNLPVVVKPTLLNRIKETLGYQGSYRYPQTTMAAAGLRLYLCIQKQIDYDKFFNICNARDVFFSFALITFMHVWMISVRLADESRSGLFVRNRLVNAMWTDLAERSGKLEARLTREKKNEAYTLLGDTFNASFFGFDEGLLGDDTILAASIWRHVLEQREIDDFKVLTRLCEYVRKNINHLEQIKEIDLLKNGIVTFIPIDSDKCDHSKLREQLYKYLVAV